MTQGSYSEAKSQTLNPKPELQTLSPNSRVPHIVSRILVTEEPPQTLSPTVDGQNPA